MILYIHGFRTTNRSYKAGLLKGHFKEKLIIADHPVQPRKAIAYLEKVIEENDIKGIIASSLGGYYATYLSEKYGLKAVLINPSVKPYETTRKYLGINSKTNGEEFEWKEKHLERLAEFKVQKPNPDNYFLFLQMGDDVLDYKVALDFYKGAKMVVEEGGNHRFKGLDRYFDEITSFLTF
ncbi:MAG: hypothetical protein GXO12_02150 [Epsilonproteobacteria bacterium]|nr:hypothetical protein [Campylobacterota bacterium]